jgi:two-component system, NtrC family, sensor kinase
MSEERNDMLESTPVMDHEVDGRERVEHFLASREQYIVALERTIEALRCERTVRTPATSNIRTSIDELLAMQKLSNSISTATDPEHIVTTLLGLASQVIPVIEANIFLLDKAVATPFSNITSARIRDEVQTQLEAGIVDWVLAEHKTVIIPDLDHVVSGGALSRNFVIVPLIMHNDPLGIFFIHTEKAQQDFSQQDIQLLTVLANQAAVGVENWRTNLQLTRAHDDLRASQAQMLQAAKLAAIGELAAGIVHEIKNPVQILMMQIEMIERGHTLPNWMKLFGEQVRRLTAITARLMDFARDVTDDASIECVDVNKAVSDIVAMTEHDLMTAHVTVQKCLDEQLPTVAGNTNALEQVFLNLIINARDAMPEGGTITVSTESTGYHLIVTIADTGTGIDKENLKKIFSPFFTTKPKGKGTGLGLPICAKIIQQHRGDIRVESEPGKGTRFLIFLPVRRLTT